VIWPTTKLKWAATTIAGGTPSVADPSNWADGEDGTAWVSISDMSGSSSVTSTHRRVTAEGIAEARLPIGEPGTLILSMYASLGHTAFLAVRASWNQAILGIYGSPSYDPRFIKYALDAIKPTLSEIARSNTQANLNAEQVGNLSIPNPPLEEQRRIADFLDAETTTIDSYVNLHERLISVLQEKSSAAIESLLLHGHVQPSEASHPDSAPFPSRFPIGRLKNVAARVDVGIAEAATHAYVSDGVPLIRSTNIRANSLKTRDMLYIAPWFAERNRSKYVFAGDILTVRTGNAGVSAIIPQDLNRSQTFTQLITTLKDGNSAEYFCQFLNSRVCRQYFDTVSWGSAQKNISVPLLANAPVPIPPIEIQRRISESVERLSDVNSSLVSKVEKARQLASERRQALITAAVTGQFDVSTASGRNVTDGVDA
jgi:type I restriction enzyme, S subunit